MAETYLRKVRREEAKTWRLVALVFIIYVGVKWLF